MQIKSSEMPANHATPSAHFGTAHGFFLHSLSTKTHSRTSRAFLRSLALSSGSFNSGTEGARRIRIGTQPTHWEEEKDLNNNSTYNHEVCNDTNGCRVVLLVDFEHPVNTPYNTLLK